MPASAPALHASLLDLTAQPMAGSRRPGHVEHEKNTFFLIAAKQPQRGWRSRAGVLCPFIEAKQRPLTATAAEATARERAGMPVPPPIFSFQHVDAAATSGYRAVTAYTPFFF